MSRRKGSKYTFGDSDDIGHQTGNTPGDFCIFPKSKPGNIRFCNYKSKDEQKHIRKRWLRSKNDGPPSINTGYIDGNFEKPDWCKYSKLGSFYDLINIWSGYF